MSAPQSRTAIRFGYGLGRADVPRTGEDALARLSGSDKMRDRYPVISSTDFFRNDEILRRARKSSSAELTQAAEHAKLQLATARATAAAQMTARILDSDDPFRERLTWFWADHFTARATGFRFRALGPSYVDEAIRPHVAGRFAEMLRAVVTHPLMLIYLDQAGAIGPNSAAARNRRRKSAALVENLAREVLELHTLGVDAAYSQQDVEQLAELFSGLDVDFGQGFVFDPRKAEPGVEVILGQKFGGPLGRLDHIEDALEMLALHPATVRHLARKLAVHFVSDVPAEDLVDHIAAAYSESGGELMAAYRALIEHPAAWGPPAKIKRPMELVASGLLACGVTGREVVEAKRNWRRQLIAGAFTSMGQPFLAPPGPDGFPEASAQWITPQRLAARIRWAIRLAKRMRERTGEPSAFLDRALAENASPRLAWAVTAAEERSQAVALVLASAEFNSR
ncbi:MAG: DUF1800 family protein [Pikeienuella sp.]